METIIEKKIINEFSKRLSLNENQIRLFIFMAEMNGDLNATHAVFGRRWDIEINEALNIVKSIPEYFTPVVGQNNSAETYPSPSELGKTHIKLISGRIKDLKEEAISGEIAKAASKLTKRADIIAIAAVAILVIQLMVSYRANEIANKQYKLERRQLQEKKKNKKTYPTIYHSCSCGCKK